MSILQIGAPKCGNFWLYQIIQQVLEKSGKARPGFIEQHPIYPIAQTWNLNFPDQARVDVLDITDLQYKYRISSIFQMPVEDIKAYIAATPHIWSHSPICRRSFELYKLIPKKVYIIRDPRDRAISASKYYCSPYMLKYFPQNETEPENFLEKNFNSLMYEWVWHVFDHLKYQEKYNIHILFFENLLADFQQEFGMLLDYLEIDLSPTEKFEIEEAVQFSNLKKKNPKHLKKGEAGYWVDHLSVHQKAQAEIIAGPLIRFLGYYSHNSTQPGIPSDQLPADFERLKQEIIESQESINSFS